MRARPFAYAFFSNAHNALPGRPPKKRPLWSFFIAPGLAKIFNLCANSVCRTRGQVPVGAGQRRNAMSLLKMDSLKVNIFIKFTIGI